MKEHHDTILTVRREAKKKPITLVELDSRQAEMNSPEWYKSISSFGSKNTPLYKQD